MAAPWRLDIENIKFISMTVLSSHSTADDNEGIFE
jgi:hypothetical protein